MRLSRCSTDFRRYMKRPVIGGQIIFSRIFFQAVLPKWIRRLKGLILPSVCDHGLGRGRISGLFIFGFRLEIKSSIANGYLAKNPILSCRIFSKIPDFRLDLIYSVWPGAWFYINGCSFHYAHIWRKSGISICWRYPKKKFHTCATCSELPSYINTMAWWDIRFSAGYQIQCGPVQIFGLAQIRYKE